MSTLAPGTLGRARQAWHQLCGRAAEAGGLTRGDIFAVPVLLRPEVLDTVAGDAGSAGDANDVRGLVESVHELASTPGAAFSYPIGLGPVEALWAQLDSTQLSETAAFSAAVALPVTEALIPAYVEALLRQCGRDVTSPAVWRTIRTRARLVRAAVEASDHDVQALKDASDRGFLPCARGLLVAVPDRKLLEEADSGGRRLLPQAPGDAPDLRFALAALWTDPYTADRELQTWAHAQNTWERRGWTELTRGDDRPQEDWTMPAATEALSCALDLWHAAYAASASPTVVNGWMDAAAHLANLTGRQVTAVDPAISAALSQALAVPFDVTTAEDDAIAAQARLFAAASYLELDLSDVGTAKLDTADLDELWSRQGREAARTAVLYAQVLSDRDPAAALRILDHFGPIFASRRATEIDRRIAARLVTQVIHAASGLAELPPKPPQQTYVEYADDLLAAQRAGGPPGSAIGALAVQAWRMALRSVNDDNEESGLKLLGFVQRTAPLLIDRFGWAVDILAADLHLGEGVNQHKAGHDAEAMVLYVRAMQLFIERGLSEGALDMVERLADIATMADGEAAVDVIGRLAGFAPELFGQLGAAADSQLAAVMSGIIGGLIREESVNLEVMWAAMQFRTGLRTAMELASPAGPDPAADPDAGRLLGQLGQLRPDTPAAATVRAAAQVRIRELVLSDAKSPPLLDADQIRTAIDERTVVLATATATGPGRTSGRIALLIWDHGQSLPFTGMLPPQTELPWLPDGVFTELKHLAEQGKDHLCVFADGGMQTIPWHLLQPDDAYLGDHWIVTLLPHPHVLQRGRRGAWVDTRRDLPVAAFGLADAGPGWAHLGDAEDEARTVASTLGGVAMTGAEATESRFRALTRRCQYLHVATHGVFFPAEPAFQAVVLHPDDGDDGHMHAWEVARLDMSGVRLVTLSACETARIAIADGDSVGGLAVAFMSAGARAVIGSQIEIETGQSRFFFERLYQALAQPQELRDAFATARDATRARFPGSTAWSSFYLLGDWR